MFYAVYAGLPRLYASQISLIRSYQVVACDCDGEAAIASIIEGTADLGILTFVVR